MAFASEKGHICIDVKQGRDDSRTRSGSGDEKGSHSPREDLTIPARDSRWIPWTLLLCAFLIFCTYPDIRQLRGLFGSMEGWNMYGSMNKAHTCTDKAKTQQDEVLRTIPDYVLEHAPYVHLFSGEAYWPCDISEHLLHTTAHVDYSLVDDGRQHHDLDSLDDLNKYGAKVFLKSDDNVEDFPEWLGGETNIPDDKTPSYEDLPDSLNERIAKVTSEHGASAVNSTLRFTQGQTGGRSDAPAVLLVLDKGNGVVDAFWFFFYSYNLGNTFFGVRFGNHVGDWEHTVIRFQDGEPQEVFFSEHSWGGAYEWGAVEKIGKRLVAYSASGTHAMYGSSGTQEYVLPFGLLYDVTDRGPLWDPKLNMHAYTYDYEEDTLRPSTLTPNSPVNWFYFLGHWGDKFYPLSDSRQYKFAGQWHYVDGPLGPRYKRLNRKHICQGREQDPCDVRSSVAPRTQVWNQDAVSEQLTKEEIEYWQRRNAEFLKRRNKTG